MPKQLLIEQSFFKPIVSIQESVKNTNGNLIVSGMLSSADKPNANKRIYPYETLFEQIRRYIDGPVKERRAFGELDHPESSQINLKNVSHNIIDVWWNGKDVFGKVEILDTPSGNILKKLFENNLTVGISSRAMGSVTPIGEGLVQVEDDLEILCWDFVSTPSNWGSYMVPEKNGQLKESLEYKEQNKYSRANKIISDIICIHSGVCCIS